MLFPLWLAAWLVAAVLRGDWELFSAWLGGTLILYVLVLMRNRRRRDFR